MKPRHRFESHLYHAEGCVVAARGADTTPVEWKPGVMPLAQSMALQAFDLAHLREQCMALDVTRVAGLSAVECALVREACATCAWVDPNDHFEVGPDFVETTRRVMHDALDRLAGMKPADLTSFVYDEASGQQAVGYRVARRTQLGTCGKLAAAMELPALAKVFESGARGAMGMTQRTRPR